MKKPEWTRNGKPMQHIVVGTPDDDCPICKAHGISPSMMPDGGPGFIIIEMGPLEGPTRCDCPLCSQLP
jgi:hypothetical protein